MSYFSSHYSELLISLNHLLKFESFYLNTIWSFMTHIKFNESTLTKDNYKNLIQKKNYCMITIASIPIKFSPPSNLFFPSTRKDGRERPKKHQEQSLNSIKKHKTSSPISIPAGAATPHPYKKTQHIISHAIPQQCHAQHQK